MKILWNNFKIAFAMFSKIPMPRADWTKENMKYFMCFFPFVGAVIGILTYVLFHIFAGVDVSASFLAMILILVPVVITGGIHIDGLLDTSDALSSWQERERRLQILKDSHAGAFAVITCCVYFLVLYGSFHQVIVDEESVAVLSLGYVLSRTLSGIGVVCFPKATETGTVAEFSRKAENRRVRNILCIYVLLLAVGMIAIHPVKGTAAFLTGLLVWGYYHHMVMKYFGGTTGDLSGWFLCICETAMVFVLAVLTVII